MADRPHQDPLAEALRLLSEEVRRRVAAHPHGHLLNGRPEAVELSLTVPIGGRGDWADEVRGETGEALQQALSELLRHRAVARPGRVYCLRCREGDCEHAAPAAAREVFAGYGPSGLPRFADLGQWLLERQEPRVEELYRRPAGLLAHVAAGEELTADLLPAYRDPESGFRLHGQVVAGWFAFPVENGLTEPLALTFQVVSSGPRRGRRRFGLNLLGTGPDGAPLEDLFDRSGELPWVPAARWAQGALGQIERAAAKRSRAARAAAEGRIEGLLVGLARRLERPRRAAGRRTRHGQKRHRERSRPTWKAEEDLLRARDDEILFDTRQRTLVVLGKQGRAHVFNAAGKLVTSIRCSPPSLERRKKIGRWRAATPEEIATFRRRGVEAGPG